MPQVTATRDPLPQATFTITLEQYEAQKLHAVLGALYGQQSHATYGLYIALGGQLDIYSIPRLKTIKAAL